MDLMNRKLTWPEVFDLVHDYCNRYLSDNDIEEWWTSNKVAAKFRIDDLDHTVNARACRLPDGSYEIVFCAGLLDTFIKYAYEVAHNSKIIFFPAKTPKRNEEALERAHIWIVFIWIDYVFQHEFAHIFCGHLELLTDAQRGWYEFGINRGKNRLSIHQHRCLEAQADRFAAANILAQFIRYHESIPQDLYGKPNSEQFLIDYIYSILYLYKLFAMIQGNQESDTHPQPFFRSFIFQIFFRDTYARVSDVPKLEDKSLENLFHSCFVEFYKHEGGVDLEEFKKKLSEAQSFFNTISDSLRELKL